MESGKHRWIWGWLGLCLVVAQAWSPVNAALGPALGPRLELGPAGNLTSTPSEVISGTASIKGAYFGAGSYTQYLRSIPSIVKFVGGRSYRVTFKYQILTAPSDGFEVLFYSPTGGAANDFLPSTYITGAAGASGTATLTSTLHAYADYQALWTINGTGALVIDDIVIADVASGQVVTSESVDAQITSYPNPRTAYVLNIVPGGTDVIDRATGSHEVVPFGSPMSFAGRVKYSKNSVFIVHNVRSHAETYEDWNKIADLPVDFLRTGLASQWPGYEWGDPFVPSTSPMRFPDRPDKAIVGYVDSTGFGAIGGWDPSFNPAWDKNGDGIIDPSTTGLPFYVDTKVFNAAWKNYAAAYWTDSWKEEIKKKLELAAIENFDGVMFDVMDGDVFTWLQAYPAMNLQSLRSQLADFFRWASTYAKTTYGTAFLVTGNLDGHVNEYFSDLGRYVDAGYYQNAFFDWTGSGVVNGYGLSTTTDHFSNPAIDFLKSQGMAVLDMDQIGTGAVSGGLDFQNYDDQITNPNLLKLFKWAIQSGSTPYSTTEFFGVPYSGIFPRFVRVLPNVPSATNSKYADWVIGSDGDDTISTGDGDDVIYGGGGNDVINGGAGINTAFYLGALSKFSIAQSDGKVIVTDNTGAEGTDTLTNIQRLQFADQLVFLSFVGAGSTNANVWVQKSYVAYYGRPADPEGLGYWANRMDGEGGSLSSIIGAFGNSDEFNRRYGGLSYTQLVTKIYQQTLGRDPDPAGLTYYVGELQAGRRTLQSITLDVLNGATTAPDSTVVANKLDVAAYYTAKVAAGCSYGTEQQGASTISGVTADAATASAAKAAINARCGT